MKRHGEIIHFNGHYKANCINIHIYMQLELLLNYNESTDLILMVSGIYIKPPTI